MNSTEVYYRVNQSTTKAETVMFLAAVFDALVALHDDSATTR